MAQANEKAFTVEVEGNAIRGLKCEGAKRPGLVWLGGFRSDMTGTKAQAMMATAAELDVPGLRFDYSGHGASGGAFEDGTISLWVRETLAVVRAMTEGPVILVGSSMGAWIALRVVAELREAGKTDRMAGLVLVAPAPDFTSRLMEPAFSAQQHEEMVSHGRILEPTPYSDEPNVITQQLIDDGRANTVLAPGLRVGCPVRIIQGTDDPDVPPSHAELLVDHLAQDDVTLTFVQGGDHRLSRDEDIALLRRILRLAVAEAV